jgi:hypothetical protein
MIKKIENKYVKLLIFVAFWFVLLYFDYFLLEGKFNILKTTFISIPTSLFVYYQNSKQKINDAN